MRGTLRTSANRTEGTTWADMQFVTDVTNGICVKCFCVKCSIINLKNKPLCVIQRIQARFVTEEKIWEGWQVKKIKGRRFAKFAYQCKDAALNLIGDHAKNKKH